MKRQIILGMGAGQCGTRLLAEILDRQPNAQVTHEQRPLLPWTADPKPSGIGDRLQRILDTRNELFVGDVATFYLPYVDEAIQFNPEIRIICLKRPRDEVVAGFCRFLDQAMPLPTNHWSEEPASGWYHDPIWTRIYPQYDTDDREEGIRRYWDEYYERADELVQRYPDNVRLWDTQVLTSEEGVREVLSFAGFPSDGQVIVTGQRMAPPESGTSSPRPMPRGWRRHPMDPRKCAILVPFGGFIHQECEESLKALERRGYQVRRVGGYAAIDQGRNQMATDALLDGFEETLWIDSDTGFHPDMVERLRSHQLPIVAGICAQKGKRAIACHIMPGTPSMVFGKRGGLVEVLYAGTGVMLVRREVYLTMQRKLRLPVCNERFDHPMIPFFLPMIRPIEEGCWYLAEDYAFCHRARQCGFRVYGDTSIRLWHIGSYRYGWEDAGLDRQRFETFTLHFGDAPEIERATQTDRPPSLDNFAMQYAWPSRKPEVPPFPHCDGLLPETREFLTRCVSPTTRLIVELGAWAGHATRFLAALAPQATIVALDSWEGRPDYRDDPAMAPFLSRLYETFLSECWNTRTQIIPVKANSTDGLQRVAEAGLEADLVYITPDHSHEDLVRDLSSTLDLFPAATILGNRFDQEGVRKAVESVTRERGLDYETHGPGWRIIRSRRPVQEGTPLDSAGVPPSDFG